MSHHPTTIKNEYTSLPGTMLSRGFGLGRGAYLGPNHLLSVRLRGTSDFVRRFYYADITGLRCQRTRNGQVINVVLLLCGVLPLGVLLYFGAATEVLARITAAVSATFFLFTVCNVGLGATCATWLHTANHTERLPSLGRYRAAKKALALLNARIVEARDTNEAPSDDDISLPPFLPYAPTDIGDSHPTRPGRSRLVEASFFVSVLLGLGLISDFWYDMDWKNTIDMVVIVVMTVVAPAAHVRTYSMDCATSVRISSGVHVIFYCTIVLHTVAIVMLVGVLDPSGFSTFIEEEAGLAGLSPADGAKFYVLWGENVLSILILGLGGLAGLLSLKRNRGPGPRSDFPAAPRRYSPLSTSSAANAR